MKLFPHLRLKTPIELILSIYKSHHEGFTIQRYQVKIGLKSSLKLGKT